MLGPREADVLLGSELVRSALYMAFLGLVSMLNHHSPVGTSHSSLNLYG
jgi:hypothetical protein